jgi:heme A synthase
MTLIILLFTEIGIGMLNVLLLTPVWLQILHLLVADAIWISLVLASAALVLKRPISSLKACVAERSNGIAGNREVAWLAQGGIIHS